MKIKIKKWKSIKKTTLVILYNSMLSRDRKNLMIKHILYFYKK